MQVIDLGDDMHFEVLPGAESDELTCNMSEVPTDGSNLVLRVSLGVPPHAESIQIQVTTHASNETNAS